jgi:hypothetical protein
MPHPCNFTWGSVFTRLLAYVTTSNSSSMTFSQKRLYVDVNKTLYIFLCWHSYVHHLLTNNFLPKRYVKFKNKTLNAESISNIFVDLLLLGLKSYQWNDYIETLKLSWWKKTFGVPPYIISVRSGHLSRTTDIPSASWIASSQRKAA